MRFGIGDIVAIIVIVLKVFGLVTVSWKAIISWWLAYCLASFVLLFVTHQSK
jgi:hypothetical protein